MTAIIPRDELDVLTPVEGWAPGYVLELGNKKNQSGLYRHWYEEQGCDYQCIDWNGEDGAIRLDMGKPLMPDVRDELLEYHDHPWPSLVTNFGFTEHVYTNQRQCWVNLTQLVMPGSYFVFCMPHPGDWEHHGVYQPHLEWYEQYANANAYAIEKLYVNRARRRPTICGRFRRVACADIPFVPDINSPLMHITKKNRRVNADEREAPV